MESTKKKHAWPQINDPVALLPLLLTNFQSTQALTLMPWTVLPRAECLASQSPKKSEHTNESNAGESGKQAREGGRAACLSACSMATIVHCTFSEPTRAEAISTQILWRDSKPRSERGREIGGLEKDGGGRKKIMHKILFAECIKIQMNWGG